MSQKETPTSPETENDLESTMQKLSLVVSLLGLSLMTGGFVLRLINHLTWLLPGMAVLPLPILLHPSPGVFALEAMSAGIG